MSGMSVSPYNSRKMFQSNVEVNFSLSRISLLRIIGKYVYSESSGGGMFYAGFLWI